MKDKKEISHPGDTRTRKQIGDLPQKDKGQDLGQEPIEDDESDDDIEDEEPQS